MYYILKFTFKQTQGDVVTLSFKSLLKDQSNEQKLELCALRKSVNDNQDRNRTFSLFSLEPNDGCNKDSLPSRLEKDTVVYLKINEPFLCQFTQVIKNVQSLNPKFVIIGSDGPIVSIK